MRRKGLTTRRGAIEALLAMSSAGALYATLDTNAWRSYAAVERVWIQDRHRLLLRTSPELAGAAQLDLDLKLAELQRRALQFQHLLHSNPRLLRGGIWQLSSLPVNEAEQTRIARSSPEYRENEDRIRTLTHAMRQHPDFETLRQAQTRLWQTPEYRELHRKHAARLQELHRTYDGLGAS